MALFAIALPLPAQTRPASNPTTTVASAATQPAVPLPDPDKAPKASFDLTEAATQAESVSVLLRSMESDAKSDRATPEVQADLPMLTTEINARLDELSQLLSANPTLQLLENQRQDWVVIDENLQHWITQLDSDINRLRDQTKQTKALRDDWQHARDRAEFFLPNPRARDVIKTALDSINPTLLKINQTDSTLRDRLLEIVKLKQLVAEQDAQVREGLESIRESRTGAFSRLFSRNEVPFWTLYTHNDLQQDAMRDGQDSFRRQVQAAWAYIQRRRENFSIQFILLVMLTIVLHFARGKVCRWADQDPGFEPAKLLFASPLSTAVVASLLFSAWIYPGAPRLFWAVIGAVALIPTVVIIRQLIDRRFFTLLNALVVFYFMDQIRTIMAAIPLMSRTLFLIEMLGATLLLASFIHSIRPQATSDRLWKLILIACWIDAVTFALAMLGNLIGYVSLAVLMGDAALKSAYLAVTLYACVSIVIGLAVIALRTRPLNYLGMVRRHQPLLLHRFILVLRWTAAGLWVLGLFVAISIASSAFDELQHILWTNVSFVGLQFSLGNVLKFSILVWLTFLTSQFVRFVLEEDVYNRFPMPTGLSYAISKMVHYAVLLMGFFFALHALDINLSNLTILFSAFVVGIGLGMQNIVNNFISGLILLFERPVKVGDVIQLNDVSGVVGHIGIRASILRTSDSSEIIIPNGNLISNQVTNWTHTNRMRGLSIPVAVTSSADPKRVIDLLTGTAAAHPRIVNAPPPQAFLLKFSADSFAYELHVWTDEAEHWIHIRSDLAVAINTAFAREGIALK